MNTKMTSIISMIGVLFFVVSAGADSIPVLNHSFESPVVPPEAEPPAYPIVSDWIEVDRDSLYSTNTGVFTNVEYAYIAGADANQLAFLGGEQGNAFLQDLPAVFQEGKAYRMTVGVCVAGSVPPDPNGLILSFYYRDPNVVEIAEQETSPPSHFTSSLLEDCSVYLPTVQPGAAYIGKTIGIAIRATGPIGTPGAYATYWDLDNVRVVEYPLVPNFNDDIIVNLEDFTIMALDWLVCDAPLTDVTGDDCVDIEDLIILTEYWLDNV